MILLFMSIWAIVIALNEVLFAAQPFTLASIAATLPQTLMFTVVLSAAVYLAKEKIIDALASGRPIDKRFVAEITPQLGHELNSMRRKMDKMDKGKKSNKAKKIRKLKVHDAKDLKNKGKNSKNEEAKSSDAIWDFEGVEDKSKSSNKVDNKRSRFESSGVTAAGVEANRRKNREEVIDDEIDNKTKVAKVTSKAASVAAEAAAAISNDFKDSDLDIIPSEQDSSSGKKAKSSLLDNVISITDEITGGAFKKNHGAKPNANAHKSGANSNIGMSLEERNAQIAKAREKLKQRRMAQIDALSEVSKEERLKAYRAKQEAIAVVAREKALQAQKRLKAQEQEKVRSMAIQKAKDKVNIQLTRIATGKSYEQALAQDKEDSISETAKIIAKKQADLIERKSIAQAKAQERIDKEIEDKRKKLEEKRQALREHKQNLANYAQQAKLEKSALLDEENDNNSRIDISALTKGVHPKQGAGLDTSALKKATLGNYKNDANVMNNSNERRQLAEAARAKLLKLQQSGQLPLDNTNDNITETIHVDQIPGENTSPISPAVASASAAAKAAMAAALAQEANNIDIVKDNVDASLNIINYDNNISDEALNNSDDEMQAAINNIMAAQAPQNTEQSKSPVDFVTSQANVRANALNRGQSKKASQQEISAAKRLQVPKGANNSPKSTTEAASPRASNGDNLAMATNRRAAFARPSQAQIQDTLHKTARALAPGRKHEVDFNPLGGSQLPKTLPQEEVVQLSPRMRAKNKINQQAKEAMLKPKNMAQEQVKMQREQAQAQAKAKAIADEASARRAVGLEAGSYQQHNLVDKSMEKLASRADKAHAQAQAHAYKDILTSEEKAAAKIAEILAKKDK